MLILNYQQIECGPITFLNPLHQGQVGGTTATAPAST